MTYIAVKISIFHNAMMLLYEFESKKFTLKNLLELLSSLLKSLQNTSNANP